MRVPAILSVNALAPLTHDRESAPDAPAELSASAWRLLASLDELRSGYRITLNTTNLTPADVLELLWEAEGSITHIELFNLKDYRQGKHTNAEAIAHIRQTLNGGSPIATKRMIASRTFSVAVAVSARRGGAPIVLRRSPIWR